MPYTRYIPILTLLLLVSSANSEQAGKPVFFEDGKLTGWNIQGEDIWTLGVAPETHMLGVTERPLFLNSQMKGEEKVGRITSPVFTIESPFQRFFIAGADGTATGTNDGHSTFLHLKSHPDGEILREMRPPGIHLLTPANWNTADLIGRKVFLEMVDGNPRIRPEGFAWIGFADYRQFTPSYKDPIKTDGLYGLNIESNNEVICCRSLPFLISKQEGPGQSKRTHRENAETIPINTQCETLYVLGLINHGWDNGVAHWGEHPELREKRDDQVYIGKQIGSLDVVYADGTQDEIPLIMGSTAYFFNFWVNGPSHGVLKGCREPFASNPELGKIFDETLRLKEGDESGRAEAHYFLPINPRAKKIQSLVVRDDSALRGRPIVSAVTLYRPEDKGDLQPFANWLADKNDLAASLDLTAIPPLQEQADRLGNALYMSDKDIPAHLELLPFPESLDGTQIHFLGGGVEGEMLTNMWTANLQLFHEKFDPETGVFWESVPKIGPWYGGYNGFGTWAPVGVYWGQDLAFARCTDHYATVPLRHLNNQMRRNNFVDYVDHWLYFYRHDHDLKNGPPNDGLDLSRYPTDAYPNWSFVVNSPLGMNRDIDPVPGGQESCGHGATVVARWLSWRLSGAPTDGWMTDPRDKVFGKSRWQSTFDAAEFICWYMDFSGMDVMFSEGETTGWAGGPDDSPWCLIPKGMATELDPMKRRANYANSNMYEPYPTWVCCVGLRCSAQMADAMGKSEEAARWRAYADRLQAGMFRLLREGDFNKPVWRVSPHSVYPSLQDSLVYAWFAFYYDGYDPLKWDPNLTNVTRNTLRRQLSQQYGHAAVLGYGYGQGWLTKAALMLDEMDDAGPLLWNMGKYAYDKNMDYADSSRGIDWRRWLYIFPEGTNILPDGRWHRIGDLSNGANEGPPMHALEICAGVDDTQPANLKIMPRVPEPLSGIEVKQCATLIPVEKGLQNARVSYSFQKAGGFQLKSDRVLPNLSVRVGPFTKDQAVLISEKATTPDGVKRSTVSSGTFQKDAAWWVWFENMHNLDQLNITWSL